MSRPWIACLCALVLLALAGCKSDVERRDEHLARADEYLKQGKVKEAVLEFRNALQRDPRNGEINLRIARIFDKTERPDDAFFFYEEAHRLDPLNAEAALGVARLGAFEETRRSLSIVNELLEREPANVEAHALKAHLHLVQVDGESALASALTAVELGPEHPGALLQLGRVHQARLVEKRGIDKVEPPDEIFEAAIDALERSAKYADPAPRATALLERARVYAAWPGHEEDALEAFRELVEATREPDRPDLRQKASLAAVEYARSIEDDAFLRWSLEQLVDAQPNRLDAWRELAWLAEAEEAGTGVTLLRSAVEQRPEHAGAQVVYSGFLDGLGRRDEAVAHLEASLPRVDAPEQILGALVTTQLAHSDPDAAKELLARLEAEHPGSNEAQLAAGQLALADDDIESAIQRLSQLGAETDSVDAYRLLAQAELRAGRPARATAAIDRALEIAEAPSVPLRQAEARVAYASADWRRVIAALNAIQQTGTELRLKEYLMSARAYFGVGRPRRGLKVLGDLTLLDPPYVPAVVEFARRAPAGARKFVDERLAAAVEAHPGDARLLIAQAGLDVRDGNDEKALATLDAALAAGQNARALSLRSTVRGRLGDQEGAIEDALLAFQVQPSSANARALAAAYESAGRLDEAIASFEEAAAVGALSADALPVLARLQLANDKTEEAIATFEKVLEQRPDATGVKNDLAFLIAKDDGDLERALALAQEAQGEAPELAPVADTLGYVYLKKEMFSPAERQFRYAIELEGADPSPSYRYHLGLVLSRQGRHAEAVEALEEALALGAEFAEEKDARQALEASRLALEEVASS